MAIWSAKMGEIVGLTATLMLMILLTCCWSWHQWWWWWWWWWCWGNCCEELVGGSRATIVRPAESKTPWEVISSPQHFFSAIFAVHLVERVNNKMTTLSIDPNSVELFIARGWSLQHFSREPLVHPLRGLIYNFGAHLMETQRVDNKMATL